LVIKSLSSKTSELDIVENHLKKDISKLEAIKIGYLTDILNPKATLLFLSIFTVVITPSTPLWAKIFMWLEMSVVTFLWYALVAFIISHKSVKSRIVSIQRYAEKFVGVVLIALGIKVALSTSK
jgi:threonine/homoserine/homoserine lactone efflux protein